MTQGIKGRPPLHLPRILAYMDEHASGAGDIANIKNIALTLDLSVDQVGKTITNHIKKAGPDAQIARVKPGVVRWVSPAERQRRKGRTRKATAARARVKAAYANVPDADKTVGEAALDGRLVKVHGYAAPELAGAMDIPALTIQRGGIKWDPPLVTGEQFTARVVHLARGVDDQLDVYFVYAGKMWKAYAI